MSGRAVAPHGPVPYVGPRPPKRRAPVTIIAGFPSKRFVVLAADSQESYGYSKTYVTKIARIEWPEAKCLIGGAGGSEFIELAVQKLRELPAPPSTLTALRDSVGGVVGDIRRNELTTLAEDQREIYAPALLVAGWSKREGVRLIEAEHSGLFQDSPSAIGLGGYLARYLIDTYHLKLLDLYQTVRFAAYVLHEVEQYVQDCAGPSRIMWLDDHGGEGELSQEAIAQHELSSTTVIDAGARWLLHGVDPMAWDFDLAGVSHAVDTVAEVLKDRIRKVYATPPPRGSAPWGPIAGGPSPSTPDS